MWSPSGGSTVVLQAFAITGKLPHLGTWFLQADQWQVGELHAPLHPPFWDLVYRWLTYVLCMMGKQKPNNFICEAGMLCLQYTLVIIYILWLSSSPSSAKIPEQREVGVWYMFLIFSHSLCTLNIYGSLCKSLSTPRGSLSLRFEMCINVGL